MLISEEYNLVLMPFVSVLEPSDGEELVALENVVVTRPEEAMLSPELRMRVGAGGAWHRMRRYAQCPRPAVASWHAETDSLHWPSTASLRPEIDPEYA